MRHTSTPTDSRARHRAELFTTGFMQVFFVALNTYFIAQRFYFGVAVASYLISMIWSFNVRRIVFGTIVDRAIYSAGAMAGSLTGLWISTLII